MSASRPVYVVGASAAPADPVLSALPGARAVSGPEELLDDPGAEPGIVVLVRRGLSAEAVLHAVLALGRGRGEWTPVLVEEGPEGPVFRTLSAGYPHGAGAVAALAAASDPAALLELRRAVAEVSRARHDINNPLTSAMAETQLLLMDVPEHSEFREPLETVQDQLRRIRDLVAGLGHLRHRE